MVVIHLKRSETDQFLYETSTATSCDTLIRELVEVWNRRLRLQRLASACEDLAKYGPAKPEELRGLDDDTPLLEEQKKKVGDAAAASSSSGKKAQDPTGFRTGEAPSEQAADTLNKTAEDAKNYISKKQVDARIALTIEGLKEKFEYLTGAIKIAFPMGLPDYDPITALTKDDQAAKETNMAGMDQDLLDPDTSTLWWAGKEFHRDQTVGDRVGKNEKTKIVARLQSKNAGAPAREPAISEEERKAMMSYWFKKQEEVR
eukprot:gb/GECG01004742.1/.p1 GENE.gb/GECG01004742.1/~~gb/GECG01004742.1/.p1  ORF type:complete len:259 (+),score=40.82 gb/GECG01004742.1/:1-777(+)